MNYDSILTAIDSTCVNRSEFYKTGKDVPDHDIAMVERVPSVGNDTLVMGILLVMALVVAYVISSCRGVLAHRFSNFLYGERKNISMGAGDSSAEPYYIFVLVLVTAMAYALPLFKLQAMQCTFVTLTGFPYEVLALFFVAMLAFIFLKYCLYKLVDWTFFDLSRSSAWHRAFFFVTASFSFLLLPVSAYLLLGNLSAEIVSQTIVFVAICYEITLILKLFINFQPRNYGLFSFFLYLCSAEIIPAIIFWHLHSTAAEWLATLHIVE